MREMMEMKTLFAHYLKAEFDDVCVRCGRVIKAGEIRLYMEASDGVLLKVEHACMECALP